MGIMLCDVYESERKQQFSSILAKYSAVTLVEPTLFEYFCLK